MRTTVLTLFALALALGACNSRLPVGLVTPVEWKDAATDMPIQHYPWPDYVTGEERNRIEEALKTIFDVGGRDARDAEDYLSELDRGKAADELKVAGRLVSEMKTVIDTIGLGGYEGKSRVMVLDRILRRFDGVQERLLGYQYGIDIDDSEDKCLRIVRGWNWWYAKGRYLQRYEPWDWLVDGQDAVDTEEEGAEDDG